MNINEAIESGSISQIVLSEEYIIRLNVSVTRVHYKPTNVYMESVNYPLQIADVKFEYNGIVEPSAKTRIGTYKYKIYYPLGSTITVNNTAMTIISYGAPIRSLSNMYYVDAEVVYDESPTSVEQIGDQAIESSVIDSLNKIIINNEAITKLLPGYNYDYRLAGGDGSSFLESIAVFRDVDLIDQLFTTRLVDVIEISASNISTSIIYDNDNNYLLDEEEQPITSENEVTINDGNSIYDITNAQFNMDLISFLSYYKFPKVYMGYISYFENVNSKAFTSWIIHNHLNAAPSNNIVIDYDKLSLLNSINEKMYIKVISNADYGIFIYLKTPNSCNYNIGLKVNVSYAYGYGAIDVTSLKYISINKTDVSDTELAWRSISILNKTLWDVLSEVIMKTSAIQSLPTIASISEYYSSTLPTYLISNSVIDNLDTSLITYSSSNNVTNIKLDENTSYSF